MHARIAVVRDYLRGLQQRICAAIADIDGTALRDDAWEKAAGEPLQGNGLTRILEQGQVFERAGCGFSHVRGPALPPSATHSRPELAGAPFEALGVSLVFHPRNPYVPTTHLNVRMFTTTGPDPVWWFGGGFDLTPYYPFDTDIVHWHRVAECVCAPFGEELYPRYKRWCDDYFYLKHRGETRGVGGLFYDDLSTPGFERCFELMQAVGSGFLDAYLPLVARRKDTPFGERERDFQRYRRGRYVEFNLVWDRGTLFGLQSGGRTESILMSLPPEVRFEYGYQPSADSPEARLNEYLKPRDWLVELADVR